MTMKEHKVAPAHDCGLSRNPVKETLETLDWIRPRIQAVLDQSGGKMLDDAADFGQPGKRDWRASVIRFLATDEAARQIAAISGVSPVNDNQLNKGPSKKGPRL